MCCFGEIAGALPSSERGPADLARACVLDTFPFSPSVRTEPHSHHHGPLSRRRGDRQADINWLWQTSFSGLVVLTIIFHFLLHPLTRGCVVSLITRAWAVLPRVTLFCFTFRKGGDRKLEHCHLEWRQGAGICRSPIM